ncbi:MULTISPECIES: hypothetical protein [Rhizobium]|uniref:Uncharacterized protein n=1 Tax=Rhizobium tropici TaxID=398 RepID=A0A6P1CAI7_RHITR|nr:MULTISPECIES: hypothetical protein [Rhizobium]AGB71020.1 hypothetical protein RTCIAT899_CH08140 [Rhizobium tropici CIAT 899]MBB4242390.1 hypothetical protein [Rhizobium tropici]MBB5594033.1 hypothetical protein [Rhizobium tropici]MBB6492846.1 hypothetical protein [Rhizobium tropici]NEV13366.1 hypothetical protein [Rhizobium tropici]
MKHRDFSELATLLAERIATPAKAAKPTPAKVRQPANDNKPVPDVLAWPALERLAYRGDKVRLFALRHWRDLCFPRQMEVTADEEQYDPEATIETRPSEAELLGAVGWKVVGKERWNHTGEIVNVYSRSAEARPIYTTKIVARKSGGLHRALDARIGELTFTDGKLMQWGVTAKGRALRPDERRRGEKGGSSAGRTDGEVWSYLKLKGAASPFRAEPYLRPISSQPASREYYTPSPAAHKGRKLLEELGIDGSVCFDKLPFKATRCPDALAANALWLGGVKQPKPTASEPAGKEPEFVRHIEASYYVDHLRLKLGDHAKVLDLAISDGTAAEIGAAMGLAPAYAAKRGAALIDEAIYKLIEVDETARADFEKIPEKIAA